MSHSGDESSRRTARVGFKFLLLAAFSTAIYFITSLPLLAGCLLLVVCGHRLSAISLRRMLAPLRMLAPVLLIIGVAMLLFNGPDEAAVLLLRLITLVLAAHLVTETTTTLEMTDAFVMGLGPLRRLGVRPERAGMALALTIRFVPLLINVAREVREAQMARGSHRNIIALAVPLIVRTLRMADEISEALEARSFDS